MPKTFYTFVLMIVSVFYATSAHAEIFRWVDANGMVYYSDQAPKTYKSTTLNYGTKLRRPGPPKKPAPVMRKHHTPKRVAPRPKRQAPSQKPQYKQPEQKQFREFELLGNKGLTNRLLPEVKPDLDAEEYDLRKQPKIMKRKKIKSVKQKLCSEKRMLLAALREKGFNSYYDEEGHYRLAWGGDGIYQGKRRFLNEAEVAKKTTSVMFEVEQYCDEPYNSKLLDEARADWIRAEYCAVSKAVLEDLEHPFMRSTDSDIKQQIEKVERLCADLEPSQYRDDDRYYPKALRAKVVLPRHLTLIEDETPAVAEDTEVTVKSPEETLEQLLALID